MRSAVSGRLITGRYRLGSVIGHGGMGVVWRARDELLGRDVAVKELSWPPDLTEQERQTACRRTVREARTAARLTHPNIIRIYDVVEEDDGQPWIVMELLPYRSLRDLVQEEGPLDPARAAQVGLGILAALRAAHAEGIVHRDVTPANILVGPGERAVLTDFGIARAAGSQTLTNAGTLVGSPSYIAPERARGASAGPPGDLWGLGASLYTAVEGHPPFERPHALATLTAVVADEPERAGHAGPLWPLISALLRKDPDARPDEAEAERLLRGVAHGATTQALAGEPRPPAPVSPGPAVPSGSAVRDPAVPPRRPRPPAGQAASRRGRPRGTLAALAVLAALAAAAVVVTLALTSSGSPRHQTAASSAAGTRPAATATATPARRTAPGSGTAPAQPSASPPSRPAAGPGGQHTSKQTGQGGLPAGFYRFTSPTGFSVGVPDGWQASRHGHTVYLQDPANSGIYLLIDQSNKPKSDPLGDWRQQQANRAGGYPGYHLIRLEPVSYPQAEKAADWEFTYDRDGVTMHILNRNILANAHHAYALYWSVPAAEWNASYHYFQAFAATFQPAS
jgi:hypothetical protein